MQQILLRHRRFRHFASHTVALAALLMCACAEEGGQEGQGELQQAQQSSQSISQQRARPASQPSGETIPSISLVPAFSALTFARPVFLTQTPIADDNRVFVSEQPGRILVFENRDNIARDEVKTFLDLRQSTFMGHNEEGLLSFVFHPKYKENGQLFVCRSVREPKRASRISRFTVSSDDPDRADPSSEQIILDVEQPWGNHNGATLLFGKDGFLYASFGDGGAANDPHNHSQNLGNLLGTIIRIDVDRTEGGRNYAIPKDNPFVNRSGAQPEIWAYGLRNVWRMSFDSKTGELWAGDVGQNLWEEIDVITKGGNYGWNLREGFQPFADGVRRLGASFQPADPFIDPVVAYGRNEGISVTGGYVYRGKQYPALDGVYIYADYGSGKFWGLRYEGGKVTAHREITPAGRRRFAASFGEDRSGEVYVCAFDQPDGRTGRIYRIAAVNEN